MLINNTMYLINNERNNSSSERRNKGVYSIDYKLIEYKVFITIYNLVYISSAHCFNVLINL